VWWLAAKTEELVDPAPSLSRVTPTCFERAGFSEKPVLLPFEHFADLKRSFKAKLKAAPACSHKSELKLPSAAASEPFPLSTADDPSTALFRAFDHIRRW
jgi:hypothetical protein